MKTNFIAAASFLGACLIFTSCQKQLLKEDFTHPPEIVSASIQLKVGGDIPYQQAAVILGSPKQNPYTVKNMQNAYNNLLAQGIPNKNKSSIATTHYYVKFKPQNDEQYEKLKRDTSINT
jgi:hypothetical protein